MGLWRGARGALGIGLIALLVLGPRDRGGIGEMIQVTSNTAVSDLAQVLSESARPDLTYADTLPPSHGIATLLAGAASSGSLVTIVSPGTVPRLRATPPQTSVAGRRSSLLVTVSGVPNTVVPVVIDNPTGTADTVSAIIDPSGVTTFAIAIEPTRAGASGWEVRAAGESVVVRAWTRPETAVRVLVLTGPPSWEGRYLIRALEASGAVVSVRQSLGRAKTVTTTSTETPTNLSDLDAFDVVAVLGRVELSEELVERWLRERGGGVLFIDTPPWRGALASWSTFTATTSRDVGAIRWSGPAEVVPLPTADLAVDLRALSSPTSGVPVAWSDKTSSGADGADGADEIYVTAGWLGRGRIFASGISTWPWAMEAGLRTEHAEYWESVVEWLAGGLGDDVSIAGHVGQPYVAWTARAEGTIPTSLTLGGASGLVPALALGSTPPSETEALRPVQSASGASHVRFVPLTPSGHALDDASRFGAVVSESEDRPSWVSAALEIGGAGGALQSATGDDRSTLGSPLEGSPGRPWFAFLLLGAVAITGWASRRLEGRS